MTTETAFVVQSEIITNPINNPKLLWCDLAEVVNAEAAKVVIEQQAEADAQRNARRRVYLTTGRYRIIQRITVVTEHELYLKELYLKELP